MKIQGQRSYDVPRRVLWRALLDPEVLSRTLPGCDGLEVVGEHEFRGNLNTRIGPVQGRFSGSVKLTDIRTEQGFDMRIDGQGPQGFTKAEGAVRLEGGDERATIHYDLDAQVGGRIASVGQRLLERSARIIVEQALDGLGRQLEALAQAATGGAPAADVAPATEAEFARGVVRGLAREYRGVLFAVAAVVLVLLALIVWIARG